MVGPFGGITAAQMLQAVLQHPQRLGDPVSLTVNFAAALADGPFTVQARPARTNRSTQHWVIEMLQQRPDRAHRPPPSPRCAATPGAPTSTPCRTCRGRWMCRA